MEKNKKDIYGLFLLQASWFTSFSYLRYRINISRINHEIIKEEKAGLSINRLAPLCPSRPPAVRQKKYKFLSLVNYS